MLQVLFMPAMIWMSSVSQTGGANPAAIIPLPVEFKTSPGQFVINKETVVLAAEPAAAEAHKLQDALEPAMGFRLTIDKEASARDNAISLQLDAAMKEAGDEGYNLQVTPKGVIIRAMKPAGLFYGVQSLRQLLPPAVFGKTAAAEVEWRVPCVSITDKPRFAWRGMMIDTARHFRPVPSVLRFIDAMALHKFNTLHFHLTDDQGWRIEIKKYPKLTEVGGWRDETLVGHAREKPEKFDGKRHGGFYTQDDIRKIVKYAADRHITVVPEIEMPGHARAAIAAYPELGCHPNEPIGTWTKWGICKDIYNPSDKTIAFEKDVLTEVMELFPSKFIHIGGDEAVKDQWKASAEVQARIKELGLKDEAEMQSWFVKQIDDFLTKNGRRLIGWDEILEGGLAPGATVMSWRGEKGGIAAAKAGHDVVMTPGTHTYFDHYQAAPDKEPLAIGGDTPLKKVYSYEPIPKELNEQEGKRVLGAQAQLWAEYIPTAEHMEYMAFPRAAALAEIVWSPKADRDYDAFVARLREHVKRLDAMGVKYRKLD